MALNLGTASSSLPRTRPLILCNVRTLRNGLNPSSVKAAAFAEGTESSVSGNDLSSTYTGPTASARTQLDLLEQLTSTRPFVEDGGYASDGSSDFKATIREQLANLVGEREDDFSIPLGKNLKKVTAKFLTTSQRRNIRRQSYLDEVSQRNDSVFFAVIGAFVILPPIVILGVAIATGYVQLFP